MLAEIIAIGDELTSGQRLDTNSQWLSTELSDLGITTVCHQTVADYLEPMVQAFQLAASRADVILVTGGLGPTADDLTRQALAMAFDAQLTFDEASWVHIQELFRKRNYKLPESNRVQAYFPAGSLVIPNPNGTAPGIDWEVESHSLNWQNSVQADDSFQRPEKQKEGARFFCLPGVPAEMKEMVKDYVLPAVRTWQGGQQTYIARKVIRTFGAGESHVESMLPDLIKRGNDPQVGITASKATISLRIEARGESPAACQEKIEPVATIVRETLGDLVFGEGDDELENAVVPLLDKSSQRLVVVEWGTAGAVSQALIKALAASDSADDAFCGSVILSGPEAIGRWLEPDVVLGDTEGLAEVEDIQRTIDSLVDVAASRFQATLAVACGPLPSASMEDQDPRRNIPFLIAAKSLSDSGQQRFHRQYHVVSHPSIWLPRAKKQVLNLLRLILMGKAES